jgi:signal transduction histidine kinase/ligand-binding sensor domain-containing protein
MKKCRGTIFFLFFSLLLYAQPDKIVFDHYGLKEGFNSREAMNIITTSNGMVWVSSNDGLARFDGKRFKFYQHISGDSNSLSNNYCKGMQTDKRGQIWIASHNDLDIFNPATEKFTHIKISDKQNEKQPVYPVCFYYDSTKDIMWVGTAKGLYFSKNGSLTLQNVAVLTTEEILFSSLIGSIAAEGNGVLWITAWRHIIKLNTKNGNTEKYELPDKVDNIFNERKIINFRSSYFDNNKTLWLGAWLTGLVEFNTVTKTFYQYCFSNYKKEQNTIYHITKTGLVEQENILWLSTDGVGLMAFDMQQKKFTSYAASLGNDPYGIKGTTYGLFTDRDKAMWIGSATGLHRYDYSKQLFKKIDLSNIEKGSGLLAVSLMELQQNKQGLDEIIWLYIAFRGGYLYNLREKKIMQVPAKIAAYINMPTQVLSFYIDTKNILWISSVEYGLTGYDIDKDDIVFTDEKLFREKWKWVSIFFEDSKKRLWIGTYHDLYRMDSSRKNIAAVETVNNELQKKGLALAIQSITEDEAGNIWFTSDNTDKKIACVGKLNPLNNQLQIIYNEKEQQAINHNPVDLRSIASDGRGKIFVTFFTEGIAWFNSKGNDTAPHFLRTENGLNSSWIDELLADKNGNIWCSTSFGLSCYKPAQNTFTNYSYISYALDNTAAPPLHFSPQSGNMYVGQSNAMLWFNTAIKTSGVEKRRLVFSEINVLNKIYNPDGKSYVDGDVIRLNHRQDMVSIEFALLNYTNAADNTYSWMLKGWDKEWNTSKNNIATYANLKPGNYTLFVKAANSQGDWIEEPVQLGIKIKPPFYQTGGFIILSILVVTGIVYWLVQQRINRIKERYRLRNKIASDLHDEIGSTLTSISILSTVSQQAFEQQPQQAKEMLQQISTQSKNIQQSMSDIVWSIRPDNERIENLVVRMREYAAQTLEPLDIKITIDADESLVNKVLPMDCRKDLLLIYKEAINNIAKHAGATVVSVSLFNGNKKIELAIQDNGTWKGDNSGTGTKSMKERASANGGQLTIVVTDKGTTVSASMPIP